MTFLARVPAVVCLVAVSAVRAQEWRDVSPGVRQGFACCYDPVRGVTVFFGGSSPYVGNVAALSDTWEWDGRQWTQRQTPIAPSGRLGSAMAFDPVRGVCVLFGGWAGASLSDTWEWNGARWRELPTTAAPFGGEQIGMATDFARGRIVLHRGSTTWEWTGSDWQGIPTPTRPNAGPLTWDPVRRRIAAFSGNTHWEWDGVAWTQISVVSAMTPRSTLIDSIPKLSFDDRRSRLQLFGGVVAGSFSNELWEWDGATWSQRTVPSMVLGRCQHGCVFDQRRGRMVVIAGASYPRSLADVWEWDGVQWTAAFVNPEPSIDHSMAADPANGRVLLLAESGGTYDWRDGRWFQFPAVPPIPSPRHGAMAFDSGRGVFVYWSGVNGSTPVADVYEWSQGGWIRQVAAAPPARSLPAMAYDPVRARLVVFGGFGTTRLLDDTWEYDGVAWREIVPTTRPPFRGDGRLAFDARRGRLVLYGGLTSFNNSLGDMWEWSGTDWLQVSPPSSPGARHRFAMATDPVRGTIVLHGGVRSGGGSVRLSDTWEWTGTTWNQLAGTSTIVERAAMAFDGARMLLFGGVRTNPGAGSSATSSVLSRDPGLARPYGTGCSGSAPPATLAAGALPFAGNLGFGVTVTDVRPHAPCALGVSAVPDNVAFHGCTLLIGTGLFVGATASAAGVIRVPLPVPSIAELVGQSVFAQAFVSDPRGVPFGLVWTQGLEIEVGD